MKPGLDITPPEGESLYNFFSNIQEKTFHAYKFLSDPAAYLKDAIADAASQAALTAISTSADFLVNFAANRIYDITASTPNALWFLGKHAAQVPDALINKVSSDLGFPLNTDFYSQIASVSGSLQEKIGSFTSIGGTSQSSVQKLYLNEVSISLGNNLASKVNSAVVNSIDSMKSGNGTEICPVASSLPGTPFKIFTTANAATPTTDSLADSASKTPINIIHLIGPAYAYYWFTKKAHENLSNVSRSVSLLARGIFTNKWVEVRNINRTSDDNVMLSVQQLEGHRFWDLVSDIGLGSTFSAAWSGLAYLTQKGIRNAVAEAYDIKTANNAVTSIATGIVAYQILKIPVHKLLKKAKGSFDTKVDEYKKSVIVNNRRFTYIDQYDEEDPYPIEELLEAIKKIEEKCKNLALNDFDDEITLDKTPPRDIVKNELEIDDTDSDNGITSSEDNDKEDESDNEDDGDEDETDINNPFLYGNPAAFQSIERTRMPDVEFSQPKTGYAGKSHHLQTRNSQTMPPQKNRGAVPGTRIPANHKASHSERPLHPEAPGYNRQIRHEVMDSWQPEESPQAFRREVMDFRQPEEPRKPFRREVMDSRQPEEPRKPFRR